MERRLLKRQEDNKEINTIGGYGMMLLNSATSFHTLHLKIKGNGSYAKHIALQEYYEGIPDLMDSFIEQYQGNMEALLSYPNSLSVESLSTPEEAVSMLKRLYEETDKIYSKITASEILAELDNIKNLINKTKYKLMFLN